MSQYPTPAESQHQPSVSPQYRKYSYPVSAGFILGSTPSHPLDSHLPASPPFSCAASQIEASAFPSPQFSVSTPPSTVLMSAEPSESRPQTTSTAGADFDHVMFGSGDNIARVASSTKRKIEDVDVEMEDVDHKRRRTDHDKQEADAGDSAQTGTRSGFGPLYKLCQTPHPISRPHPSQNLLALYGLNDMAASVARKDPKTGEKINKLRKSYEGKVKDFGLAGKNKAVSAPNEFTGLIAFPDEEWHNQRLMGKELEKGFSQEILSKLEAATTLAPGKLAVDEHERWRNILAIEDAPRIAVQQAPASKTVLKSTQLASPANALRPDIPRPKRKGTKRRYDEDSFEGYGEGFADDTGTGVSDDGDDDHGVSSTKRRKRKDLASSPGFTGSLGQYSAGAVSVGNGSYSGR